MNPKVLVVSYFFPPVGGAGVQRVAKFVKYLPTFGWQPVVLTAANPSVPVFDDSLLADIPTQVEVIKARTLEPDYAAKRAVSAATEGSGGRRSLKARLKGLIRALANLVLQPDPQVLWLPAAYRAGCHAIRAHRPAVIFTSAPPFSSLVLGALLARKFRLPLVVDYRDEWDISNSVWENKGMGRFSLWLQQRMQRYVLRAASAIVATTRRSADTLQAKARGWGVEVPVVCIYNGYDAADFPPRSDPAPGPDLRLAYVGTLWNLTSIAPLVTAIEHLCEQAPELAARLHLETAGRRTAEQQQVLARLEGRPLKTVFHDYLSHGDALTLMRQADVLILLLSDLELAQRVVPGKLFEYLATGNRIYVIAPAGEVWDLVAGYPRARCLAPADTQAICAALEADLGLRRAGGSLRVSGEDAQRFERKSLSGELAELLTRVSA